LAISNKENHLVQKEDMKKMLLLHPTTDSLIHLMAAWRAWLVGAIVGALVASLLYGIILPQYRARATVLVNQNLEQALPNNCSDREIYIYLQRETDKLVVIAWSDQVMASVSTQTGITVSELRDRRLHLSQPSDGGWHFLADASDPQAASSIASIWAGAFVESAQTHPTAINPFVEINYTESQDLPVWRTASLGSYVFGGSLIGAVLLALGLLFIDRKDA
jgi:capsular polysaccharide biosynthesis protein